MSITRPESISSQARKDLVRLGVYDYSDLATQTTPIVVAEGDFVPLTNDAMGATTDVSHGLYDVPALWDATAGAFDWQHLEIGDAVDIRTNLTVTTQKPNQNVRVYLELGITAGFSYKIPFIETAYKAVESHVMSDFSGVYMGNSLTLDNPARFVITSDGDATVAVNGWYCKVLKKGV